MSRTKRLREEVRSLLEKKGEANTVEIFDHLNTRFSWGATMNQVRNILAKDIRFEKIGHVRDFFRGGRYTVCIWALRQVSVAAES
ncbi:MAG TPA: DUF3860 domain-containing protein [Candidatus Thalassarchaeaceae archaeon]|nr:MAG TPA: DUF3860 domain-containing protein [Candidatus Poseidoniales archaeon]HIH84663.1 DUF3860 domain-containing protein [Candidatus Thalassarchaeaceae archaeon]